MPSFNLPRQALQGLYAAVYPRIRFLSRQWMQKGSDIICCPCRYSADSALPSLSTWLARWWTWRQTPWCGWSSLVRSFCVYPVHEELVEVAYEWCQQQEHSVLCHGGLWQPCPSEAIVTPHSRRHRSRHLTKNPQSRALIAERCAPKSQDFVDYRIHKTGKMLPHMKYSSKRSDFLRFYAYLCHVIDDFCLFWFAALRQVKNLTWQNPELLGFAACRKQELFCCSGTYKKVKLKCCGI